MMQIGKLSFDVEPTVQVLDLMIILVVLHHMLHPSIPCLSSHLDVRGDSPTHM